MESKRIPPERKLGGVPGWLVLAESKAWTPIGSLDPGKAGEAGGCYS